LYVVKKLEFIELFLIRETKAVMVIFPKYLSFNSWSIQKHTQKNEESYPVLFFVQNTKENNIYVIISHAMSDAK